MFSSVVAAGHRHVGVAGDLMGPGAITSLEALEAWQDDKNTAELIYAQE